MNDKHEKHFLDEFPDIYVAMRTGEPFTEKDRAEGMLFGFTCGDGWFTLINTLSRLIRGHMKNYNRDKSEDKMQVKALQVKEKFGGLRFYVDGADEYVHGLIDLAESMSYEICENCSSTDNVKQAKKSWIQYLCETCRENAGLDTWDEKDEHIPNQETLDSMEKTERGEGLTEYDTLADLNDD